jgi:hypothetical protein
MILPVSTTIDVLNAVVTGVLAYRLFRAYQQEPHSITLRSFFAAYICLMFAYIFLSSSRIFFSHDQGVLATSFTIGNGFFLLTLAFFSRVVLTFALPKFRQPFFILALSIVAIAFFWSMFSPAQPITDLSTGITSWNITIVPAILSGLLVLSVLLPSSFLFIRRGLAAKGNQVVRVRSLSLGIGSFLYICSGVFFYATNTETLMAINDLLSIFALFIIFLGVAYHRTVPGSSVKNSSTTPDI